MAKSVETLPQSLAMLLEATEKVCAMLYSLPFEELHALGNYNFPWLLSVKGMCLTLAVDTVRRSIMAISDEQYRLQCIATLHAWLIPRCIYRVDVRLLSHRWDSRRKYGGMNPSGTKAAHQQLGLAAKALR
ncbi:hypothetical protein MRX96_046217 [Rhipicephalus microplus]